MAAVNNSNIIMRHYAKAKLRDLTMPHLSFSDVNVHDSVNYVRLITLIRTVAPVFELTLLRIGHTREDGPGIVLTQVYEQPYVAEMGYSAFVSPTGGRLLQYEHKIFNNLRGAK